MSIGPATMSPCTARDLADTRKGVDLERGDCPDRLMCPTASLVSLEAAGLSRTEEEGSPRAKGLLWPLLATKREGDLTATISTK